MFRKILFWLHLSASAVAGLVILVMSETGVLLAWQRQIIRFADRSVRSRASAPGPVRKSPKELLAGAIESRHAVPTALILRSDAGEPPSHLDRREPRRSRPLRPATALGSSNSFRMSPSRLTTHSQPQ
jgi:hypothetical protein